MKRLLSIMAMALLVLSLVPGVFAAGIGIGLEGDIIVEEFVPIVWQCGHRVLWDDDVQPWRFSAEGDPMCERTSNYLFEGERYQVDVVVFDKNKIQDVMVDLKLEQSGDDFTINCVPNNQLDFSKCNARIDEEEILEPDPDTMQGFLCTIDILDSEHMYGDMWMTVEACDTEEQGGECGEYDEIAPWFINPMIELGLDGDLVFDDVRPGTASYATISIENEAEGGVLLDMFITGDNWPSATSDLGRCYEASTDSLVNYLPLEAFRYYAETGIYSTRMDYEADNGYSSVIRDTDTEGYVNINQQIDDGFTEAMFWDAEIIQADPFLVSNIMSPGEQIALTFRLMLPEPCYGDFESEKDGSIFIWAEAI